MRNVHGTFITYIHRIQDLEIRKTHNDFSVQVRTFLLPLSLKVLRHKERGTIFQFLLFHLPPPNTCGTRHKGLREQAKVNHLVWCPVLNSDFLKISQNPPCASGAWRHSHSPASVSPLGYGDISEWHVRSARTREHQS